MHTVEQILFYFCFSLFVLLFFHLFVFVCYYLCSNCPTPHQQQLTFNKLLGSKTRASGRTRLGVQPGGASAGRTGASLRPPQQQQFLRIEGFGPHDDRAYFAFSEMATKTVQFIFWWWMFFIAHFFLPFHLGRVCP